MKEQVIACSFCQKTESEVAKMLAGHSVWICNECVEISSEICKGKSEVKKEMLRKSALLRLKKLVKKGSVVYTVSRASLLIVSKGRILDISDIICDLFDIEEPQRCNIGNLSALLHGSKRAIKRERL